MLLSQQTLKTIKGMNIIGIPKPCPQHRLGAYWKCKISRPIDLEVPGMILIMLKLQNHGYRITEKLKNYNSLIRGQKVHSIHHSGNLGSPTLSKIHVLTIPLAQGRRETQAIAALVNTLAFSPGQEDWPWYAAGMHHNACGFQRATPGFPPGQAM